MTRNGRLWLVLALLSGFSLTVYLAISQAVIGLGFPLDDAWIHQTYARNLGTRGEWAFLPGTPSAGSTSPLWTMLIAPAYWLGIEPKIWTYLLGWAFLALTGMWGWRLMLEVNPGSRRWAALAGGFLVLEWHLVWAAGSGMETLLFAWFILLTMGLILRAGRSTTGHAALHWALIGLVVGSAVWIRPDGVTLLGPAALTLWVSTPNWRVGLRNGIAMLWGALPPVLLYFMFNYRLADEFWPTTLFAKQVEYAVLREQPLVARLLRLGQLPLVGAGSVLLPGFIVFLWKSLRGKSWPILALFLWYLGTISLYAWRLPVTYQHGRYLIPAMPVFFLLGLAGSAHLLEIGSKHFFTRTITRSLAVAGGLLLGIFWVLGGQAFGKDVALIESEMVESARWVNRHTRASDLVAAHDIGALGYFTNRQILDLAGLISPEVIPFMRDEAQLAQYLQEKQADYLVVFPDWYESLGKQGSVVYQGTGKFSVPQGGLPMQVIRLKTDP